MAVVEEAESYLRDDFESSGGGGAPSFVLRLIEELRSPPENCFQVEPEPKQRALPKQLNI